MSRLFNDVEELAKKEVSNNKIIAERATSGSSSLNVLRPVTLRVLLMLVQVYKELGAIFYWTYLKPLN